MEVLLILPLYAILFVMWWRFRHLVKMMADEENAVGDAVDTPKEGVEQHRSRECLRDVISKGKAYLLGGKQKWTKEKIGKASDETINKKYTEYKKPKLNEKGEKTGKASGKHVINLYFAGISQVVKIRNVKNYSKILRMIRSSKIRWLT